MVKAYRAAFENQKTRGSWRIERCSDGGEVAAADMVFTRTFRWWMLDFFDRYKVTMGDDPVGALAADFAETERARAKHQKLVADVEAWRHKGVDLAAGGKIAGVTPADSGAFASPVRADGTLDHWDNRLMAGELAGTAVEEATKAGLQKVVGTGKVGQTVANTGGALVGGATQRAVERDLPADHYFADLCSAVVWVDAAYAHRPDYRQIVQAMVAAYPDLDSGYSVCLTEGAAERKARGVKP